MSDYPNKYLACRGSNECEAADEIERQAKRIAELEAEKSAIVNAYHEREMRLIADNERLRAVYDAADRLTKSEGWQITKFALWEELEATLREDEDG